MPLYDVHLRLPVRFKFRNVEASSHEEAIAKVESDQDRMTRATDAVRREWKDGPLEYVEMDEAQTLSALVDLVGDEDHENTLDFDYDDAGRPVRFERAPDPSPPTAVETAAHEAAGTAPPAKGAVVDPVAMIVHAAAGDAPADEAEDAAAAIDHAVRRLLAARDAIRSLGTVA